MNNDPAMHYRLQNALHTFLLLAGMLLLLGLIGWLISGFVGVIWALGTGVVLLTTASRLSPRLILYLYGAQLLTPDQFKPLTDILDWLANRSHLPKTPQLYYMPSRAMLAFSLGMQNETAIGVSHGLLQQLNSRDDIMDRRTDRSQRLLHRPKRETVPALDPSLRVRGGGEQA